MTVLARPIRNLPDTANLDICTTSRVVRQNNMVMSPEGLETKNDCWRGPAAIYPTRLDSTLSLPHAYASLLRDLFFDLKDEGSM
jgi:hypothetical protein